METTTWSGRVTVTATTSDVTVVTELFGTNELEDSVLFVCPFCTRRVVVGYRDGCTVVVHAAPSCPEYRGHSTAIYLGLVNYRRRPLHGAAAVAREAVDRMRATRRAG